MGISEKEIIEGCIRQDRKCQKALYDKYSAMLFTVCRYNSRCKEDAEDIFQEAFIKLFHSLDKFSFRGSFEGWLKKFFYRCCWNYYRSKKQHFVRTEDLENYSPVQYNGSLESFSDQQLLYVLQQLDDKERMIFNLFDTENLTMEEIVQRTNLQVSTLLSMHSRVKKKILHLFYNLENDNNKKGK